MEITKVNLLHFLLITILSILLLLFGETFLGLVVAGITTIIVIIFHLKFFEDKNSFPFYLSLVWVLYLLSILLSSIYSVSIPLAVHESWRLLFVFILHYSSVVFLSSGKQREDRYVFLIIALATTSFVLVLLALLFGLIPNITTLVPGMNLLIANYGHSHLASLLLMILPLIVGFLLNKKGKTQELDSVLLFLVVVFSFAMIITYGRTALILFFTQILFLKYYLKISNSSTKFSKIFNKWSSVFIFTILVPVFIFSAINTFLVKDSNNCLAPFLKLQLCKPITEEKRIDYFKQAAQSIRDQPLLGYGPGSFSLISYKFRTHPDDYTAYAHNVLLHIFSEQGIFALLFFLSLLFSHFLPIIFLSKRTIPKVLRKPLVYFSLVAVVSSFINALLDFDWSFISILVINFVLLAFINREVSDFIKDTEVKKLLYDRFSLAKKTFIFSSSSIVVLLCIYIVTEISILNKREDLVVRYFPYFSFQQILLVQNSTGEELRKLYQIYKYHPNLYQHFPKKGDLSGEELSYYYKLDSYNFSLSKNILDLLIEERNYLKAVDFIQDLHDLLQKKDTVLGYEEDYLLKRYFASKAYSLGYLLLNQGLVQKSAEAFRLSQQLHPWSIENLQFPDLEYKEMNLFVTSFGSLDSLFFSGSSRERVITVNIELLIQEMFETDYSEEKVLFFLSNIQVLSSNSSSYQIWNQFFDVIMNGKNMSLSQRQNIIHAYQFLGEEIGDIDDSLLFDQRVELAKKFLEIGNTLTEYEKFELASKAYISAAKIDPNALQNADLFKYHLGLVKQDSSANLIQKVALFNSLFNNNLIIEQEALENYYFEVAYELLQREESDSSFVIGQYIELKKPFNGSESFLSKLSSKIASEKLVLSDEKLIYIITNLTKHNQRLFDQLFFYPEFNKHLKDKIVKSKVSVKLDDVLSEEQRVHLTFSEYN